MPFFTFAQEIKGEVTNSLSEPLTGVSVFIREKDNGSILFFSNSDINGKFSISLNKNFSELIVEFRSLGFESQFTRIKNLEKGAIKILDVELVNSISNLEEVFITTKKKPIIVKRDTILYNIEVFKDGTEEVIEDLIKKLPGISVNKEGKIFFKGKAIKNFLLDGDNLFDENYQIGTKNIDIDLIDGVSAIENYVENPLLQGTVNSEEVALNVAVKKGEFDFSNDHNIGIGVESRLDVKSNLLGISKTYKSFATLSFNNTGREYSPYEYFSPSNAELNSSATNFLSRNKIISERLFSSDVGNERARINNNFFTSANAIIKFSPKLESKINIDFKKDRLTRTTNEITDFISNDSLANINQEELFIKRPTFFKSKLDLNYKLTKSSSIKSETIFSNARVRENSDLVSNDFPQKSALLSEELKIQQELRYTNKVARETAFLSTLSAEYLKMPQRLTITPDIRLDSMSGSFQSVSYNSFYLNQGNSLITNSTAKNVKLSAGFTMNASTLMSSLENINQPTVSLSNNNLQYIYYYPWLETNYFQKLKNWRFKGDLKFWYFKNEIKKAIDTTESASQFILSPKMKVSYKFNPKSSLQLIGTYDVRPLTIDNLFKNTILTGYNNSISNQSNLEILESYASSLEYQYYDFLNLFQLRSGISYSYKPNNFLANIEINDFLFSRIRQLEDVSFTSLSFNTNVDTYINILKSNLRVNTLYGISNYSNFVNSSDLRENTSYNGMIDLNLKTGFFGIINFELSSQFMNTVFKSKGFRSVSNSSFNQTFKTYISPFKGLQIASSVDYFRPNIDREENFVFFDMSITYKPENGKISYSLISNNITSRASTFQTINVSDFSSSVNFYSIVEPYALFAIKFKL